MPERTTPPNPRTSSAAGDGRRANSIRRRHRVVTALHAQAAAGTEISVSSVARAAGVDRSFLYRHTDLLAQIHSAQLEPPASSVEGAVPVTRESLKADVANARQTITRMATHTRQLEHRLSEILGEKVWSESGLGAPHDVDHLNRRISELEQQILTLKDVVTNREAELSAARAANRELFAQINTV